MSAKNINYPQSLLVVAALFGLIAVSTTTITALNPILEDSNANLTSGNVAGVSTINEQKLPLEINLSNSTPGSVFETKLVSDSTLNTIATVKLNAEKLRSGSLEQYLLSIYNPNNKVVKTKVEFFFPEELKGKVKVYLEDDKDSLIMYTQEQSYGPKTITLENLSSRNFKIRVENSVSIVTPVEFALSFTNGY